MVILVGPSGSGKSTYVRGLGPCTVCSADAYFLDSRGKYAFDFHRLSEAHGQCLRGYVRHLQDGTPNNVPLVVDNTNCTLVELAPYVALALAYDRPLEIRAPGVSKEMLTEDEPAPVAEWAARNTHGVPLQGVQRQWDNLKKTWREWPRHWPALECRQ
ncbi:MAG: AAA family ATPase [bacterium]